MLILVVGVRAARAEKWECEPHRQRSETGGSASRTGRDVRQVGVRAARAIMGQVGELRRLGRVGRVGQVGRACLN